MANRVKKQAACVEDMIAQYGGREVAYRDLPEGAQRALFQYMAIDGEAWDVDDGLNGCISKHGGRLFGYMEVPMGAIRVAFERSPMQCDDDDDLPFDVPGGFDRWVQWYAKDGAIPDHGDSVWPVILGGKKEIEKWEDGLISDGSHRLCSYALHGSKSVPCIYYTNYIE
jgi:hypothetical protein